ncbi:MAG: DUF1800 domain-containing protein, partial [Polaribacter sp.]|nr:DUF1800 domain-containing protein [Polaribacter sp.]
MIKSPIDLMFSVTKSLQFNLGTTEIKDNYEFALLLHLACADLEQAIFSHPDVAGWKAYYQEPLYYKTWVNNFLLPKRLEYCKVFVTGGTIKIDNKNYTAPPIIPVLEIAASINNAVDPNILINELAKRLFNYPISNEQI